MSKQEAQEIFDGVMLSDGNLNRHQNGTNFRVGLSKISKDGRITMEDNYNWLQYIMNECLSPLCVKVSHSYPKYGVSYRTSGPRKEEPYQRVALSSRQSDYLTKQYNRWHSWTGEWTVSEGYEHCPSAWYRRGDTKIVPEDLILTPRMLAHWFIGDGGLRTGNRSGGISLFTNCFTEDEVRRLTEALHMLGVITIKPSLQKTTVKGSGLVIQLSMKGIDHFYDIIEPYMFSHRGMLRYRDNFGIIKSDFNTLRQKLRRL